jgi:hypothetical protein
MIAKGNNSFQPQLLLQKNKKEKNERERERENLQHLFKSKKEK